MAKQNQRKTTPEKSKKQKIESPKVPAAPLTDKLDQLESRLRAKSLWVAVVLFLVALVPRTLYYQQAKDTPLQSFVRWTHADMEFFDRWGKHIAAGDWLSDTALHPYHGWHIELAKGTFLQYPDVAQKYYAGSPTDSLAAYKAFINHTYNGKVFHQEPLYAYMIAITYKLFGSDSNWVYLWQLLLGAITIPLVFLTGLRALGALPGLLAAVAVLLSGPIMVFEMVLLRTPLTVFFTVLLLYVYILTLEQPTWRRLVLFGVVSGLAIIGQSYLILFILSAWLWLSWTLRKQLSSLGTKLTTFTAAFLLTLSPVFYRNAAVGTPTGSLASHAAMAYIPLNSSTAQPLESFYVHQPTIIRIMHETDGKLGATVLACLSTFDDFESFRRVYRQKIQGVLMQYEMPNNMNYYFYKEFSPMLKQMPALYFLIAPLGLAGIFLGFRRLRVRFLPVFIMILVSVAPMFIAGSMARYRAPLSVVLALSAAYFIVEIIRLTLSRQWRPLIPALLIGVLLYVYTSGLPEKTLFIYNNSDLMTMYRHTYADRLNQLEREQNFQAYAGLTKELLGYVPDYFFKKKADDLIETNHEADCSRTVISFLNIHMFALERSGRFQEIPAYRRQAATIQKRVDDFDQIVNRR